MINETKKFKWTAAYQEDFANYKFQANEAIKLKDNTISGVHSLLASVADLVNKCSDLTHLYLIIKSINDIQRLTEPQLSNSGYKLFYHQRKFELNELIWLKAVEIVENTIDLGSQFTSKDLKHMASVYLGSVRSHIDEEINNN